MGSIFARPVAESNLKDAFIDFENAKPKSDEEKEIFESIGVVLTKAHPILEDVKNYEGADKFIRDAIAMDTRSEESESKAWAAICPIVARLKTYFDYSGELDQEVPRIVAELAKSPIGESGYPDLSECMVKQFCDVVSFAFEFDGVKIRTPSIQNDLAYYKRRMAQMQMSATDGKELPVDHELAARISMFFATATPMLTTLCMSTHNLVNDPKLKLAKTLETMIEVTIRMLENISTSAKFESEDTVHYIMRVMTGLVIIYDHVHDGGAFQKRGPVDIKAAVTVLKSRNEEVLLDALRYSTKHFNDESTPPKIKALLVK